MSKGVPIKAAVVTMLVGATLIGNGAPLAYSMRSSRLQVPCGFDHLASSVHLSVCFSQGMSAVSRCFFCGSSGLSRISSCGR